MAEQDRSAMLDDGVRCAGMANEVHHAKGRVGRLLNDTEWWVALCSACHRWVTEHPAEAKRVGLSASRHEHIR